MTGRFTARFSATTSTREAAILIALARAAPLTLSLLTTPYVVTTVGLRSYGFWAITGGFSAWLALLDFGIGNAVQQRIASSSSSTNEVGRCVGTALALAAGLATLPPSIAVVALWAIPARWTDSLPSGWQLTVVLVAVSVSLSFIGSVPSGLLKGRSSWRSYSLATATGQVVFPIVSVFLLSTGAGLVGLGVALVASCTAVLLLSTLLAAISDRQALSAMTVDRALVGPILRYGANVQVSNIVQVVNTQTDKLILALFAPLAWVGLFELGARLALYLRWFTLSVFPPMVSRAASVEFESDRGSMSRYYHRQIRQTYRFLISPSIGSIPMLFAFVFLWLGSGFRVSALVAATMTLAYSLNLLTGPGTSVARGAGRPSLDRNYSLLGFAINIVGSITLGLIWGGWGVIAATVLGIVVSSLVLLLWVDRWLGADVLSFKWAGYAWPARVELPALIVVSLVGVGLASVLVHGRPSAFIFLAIGVIIVSASLVMHYELRRRRSRPRAEPHLPFSGGAE